MVRSGGNSWDDFVIGHSHGHLLQTEGWAALKEQFGWQSQTVTFRDEGKLVAGAQVLYRWFPRGRSPGRMVSVAYVPKGPLVDWENPAQVRLILERIAGEARRNRAIFLRIEPDVMEGEFPGLSASLANAGFRPAEWAVQPRRTILLDIGGTEEAILGQMKQKTRYNIRLAGRKGVAVEKGGEEDLATFNTLLALTGERSGFGVHSPAYYQTVYDLFAPGGVLGLLIAKYEGQPLAALMVFALGKTAWYFYGGSGNQERQRMPNHLLQWEAIRWARAKGCSRYDLWGVPDEDQETLEAEFAGRSEGLWGVYRFKRGFGGELVRWTGAYDRVFNWPLYWLAGRLGV